MASSSTPIHRVRFVDYEPSPITSLSFTPLPLPSADPKQKTSSTSSAKSEFGALVVARQNGQVDIWEWASTETQEAQGKGRGICGGWVLDRVSVDVYSSCFGASSIPKLIHPPSLSHSARSYPPLYHIQAYPSCFSRSEIRKASLNQIRNEEYRRWRSVDCSQLGQKEVIWWRGVYSLVEC